MAVAMVGQAADWEFGVNPAESWNGYVNAFELDNTTFATGFGEDPLTGRGTFSGATLSMQPNTRLYDDVIADAFWVDQITFEANKIIEFNMYQEVSATIGDTVTFDFETIANNVPAGYTAIGFIKVLDGFASWATTQFEQVDLVAGNTGHLELTVADAGSGSEILQAGFALRGVAVTAGSADALTAVQIIPEPATIGLVGIAGLGMFVARRRFKV